MTRTLLVLLVSVATAQRRPEGQRVAVTTRMPSLEVTPTNLATLFPPVAANLYPWPRSLNLTRIASSWTSTQNILIVADPNPIQSYCPDPQTDTHTGLTALTGPLFDAVASRPVDHRRTCLSCILYTCRRITSRSKTGVLCEGGSEIEQRSVGFRRLLLRY